MLTKSKYLAGIQCPRYLWTLINDKEKIPPFDISAQFRMDEVGIVDKIRRRQNEVIINFS